MIDLHIHTTASDGAHSPEEVVGLVRGHKLLAFGVADHNAISSLEQTFQLAQKEKLCFFPAVEFDTLYKNMDLHLLAYGIEFKNPECQAWMKFITQAKMEQTRKRVEKLKAIGFKIEYEELVKITKGKMPTGGDYIRALSLAKDGRNDPRLRAYIDGPRSNSPYLNFYLDWLKAGRPAFVPFSEMECTKVMKKAHQLCGVTILAHPSDTPLEYVKELAEFGLMGLEIYTSYHSPELTLRWLELARKLRLMITAGSDFHGKPIKPDVKLGIECPEEQEIIDRLSQALDQSKGIYLRL